jgi:effector-binding domain-containing protein
MANMVNIETGKELIMNNLISLRKNMNQREIDQEIMNIKKFFELNQIRKVGPLVTTTYSVDSNEIYDIEILVQMNKTIKLPLNYKFKPKFVLKNAVYSRHIGHPDLLKNVYKEMANFIVQNGLQQITTAYTATINDSRPNISNDNYIIDIYIGVNSNIL